MADLEIGVDDYLTKQLFEPRELLLRIGWSAPANLGPRQSAASIRLSCASDPLRSARARRAARGRRDDPHHRARARDATPAQRERRRDRFSRALSGCGARHRSERSMSWVNLLRR